jgi:hypothetical protein
MYGGEDTDMQEYAKGGGIPQRYKNKGFTKVGAKKKSTRPGKKWMVLAKKGDKYKIVHGGDSNMKDFKQHGSAKRKKRFWDRMGGRNGPKAKDPFSPLYWHKRFGTWAEGGEFEPHMMYNPETGEGYMANSMDDHLEMKDMGYLHEDEMSYGGQRYAEGGPTNKGFQSLPEEVQRQIIENMEAGGQMYQPMDIFNYDSQDFYMYGGEGKLKTYQFAGQPQPEDLFTQEEQAAMMAGLSPIMLDEATVSATRMNPLQPKPIPSLIPALPNMNLAPVFKPEQTEAMVDEDTEDVSQDNRLAFAMARIGAASRVNNIFDNLAAKKAEAQQRTNFITDNFIPMNTGNDRGDFDINTGIFRPDQYVPTQFQAQMKHGGEIGMVDDATLKALIAAGADIELLD